MTPFPPDYYTARDRFRTAVDQLGWVRHSLRIEARGPSGEELTIDVGLSTPTGPEPVLLLSSGVHGIEGFFGSAVQLALLDEWQRLGPPAGVRVLLLHAVNPYGFAYLRRFDEANVDPNRNYRLAGEKFAGAPPLYGKLDSFLNPRRPPSRWEPFTLKSLWHIARHGLPALKQSIAGGQHEYPKGLFYGGAGPSRSQILLLSEFASWLADAPRVVHLDFHTGLGACGTYKLLMDPPIKPEQLARAVKWFGPDVVEASTTDGVAYQTPGAFLPWCAEQGGGRDYLALCAEFGTYGNIDVLASIRAENQAHHWSSPDDPATRNAKQRLLEVFCPASATWRTKVLADAMAISRQAVQGIRV